MKITLFEYSRGLVLDILRVEVGRFNGSLIKKEQDGKGNTFWDVLYIVGVAAIMRT